MRVLIRVDIGQQHGMGHAVRCLALARALQARGSEVAFVTATEALAQFVAPFECRDVKENRRIVENNIVILDHATDIPKYGLLRFWRESGNVRIVRIDHPDATPETCDLLILPNLHTPPVTLARLQEAFGDHLLAGADYVMLPPEVTTLAPIPYAERQDGPIAFCAGGSDPDGVLQQMWAYMQDCLPGHDKIFLRGAYDPKQWFWYDGPHRRFMWSFDHEYLRTAALVVTTMGNTVYECLYWQTPVLVVGHTERHSQAMLGLRKYVACCDIREQNQAYFSKILSHTWQREARQVFSEASAGLLDGNGVERIAERILAL